MAGRGETNAQLLQSLTTTFMMTPFMSCDVRPVIGVDQASTTIGRG